MGDVCVVVVVVRGWGVPVQRLTLPHCQALAIKGEKCTVSSVSHLEIIHAVV